MDAPPSVARAAILLEKHPSSWRRPTGGYSPAERWIVTFTDGSSCFVKAGVSDLTRGFLRSEYSLIYSRLDAPFLPRLLGWEDDDEPMLVLEDLSAAYWPPPWARDQVDAVLRTLDAVHAMRLPGLPPSGGGGIESGSWSTIADDPRDLLSLGLCSEAWLRAALPVLVEAEAAGKAAVTGDDLVHLDVRSDNLCIAEVRVVLVDWNWAARGNGELDLAFWLPSLHSEGGPAPEEILPDAPHWAALTSGFFASRAGLPVIPNAPHVREVQLSQLRSALPWAQRALGLPPLS